MVTKLSDTVKIALANSFALYLKTHYFHWNVEGLDFYQYHKLFELIYSEIYESIDDIAEHIRALQEYAPGSFTRFKELTSIEDTLTIPTGEEMARILLQDIQITIISFHNAYVAAEAQSEVGLENFLQDRIDKLQKHAWMLRSSVKHK